MSWWWGVGLCARAAAFGQPGGMTPAHAPAADVDDAAALGLQNYPYISTGKASYTPELTRLLSQQANWQVAALRPQIARLLGQAGR